jgi:hydroxyethylthiazole kinase-like uncharacterized protein yjeF
MQRGYGMGGGCEVLSSTQMADADRLAIESGPFDGYRLMQNAGQAVFTELLTRYPQGSCYDILCGPGNNGGDGYVIARLLLEAGFAVQVWADGVPRADSDAERAGRECPVSAASLAGFKPRRGHIVVDALYGAGLSRSLDGDAERAAAACRDANSTVVAIDLPSGLSGDSGEPLGSTFEASLTVTFFRPKPAHLLEPGRSYCGELVVADIGIPEHVLAEIRPSVFVNAPAFWSGQFPRPQRSQHKYSRGHTAVFSGGVSSSGAARLSAMAAARVGAGAVTVISPASALLANASHLTSIMLKKLDEPGDLSELFAARWPDTFVLGPGYGLLRPLREMVLAVLAGGKARLLVLDADALTGFGGAPEELFAAIAASDLDVVLTPHEGEFGRLFPDIAETTSLSKLERARRAAARSRAVVVYKGPDTVIAQPEGRAAINANGSAWLATAGSGDILAGFIAGLGAQKMPAFEAACAAVWLHAEAATRHGPGLIAEDLPALVPALLRELL